jgi:hypothetical protein
MRPMSLRREDVDRLLAPEFVEGLLDAPVDEIRAKGAQCRRVEDLVSYLRRVAQGQIDLVTAELAMRTLGPQGDHQRLLVEDLPSILANSPTAAGTGLRPEPGGSDAGRQTTSLLAMPAVSEVFGEEQDFAPDEIAAVIPLGLDPLSFSGGIMPGANLESLASNELEELVVRLGEYESLLSAERRVLHERIDQLRAIVVERYKSGAAHADTLLGDHDGTSGPDDAPADPEDDSH